MVSNNRAKKPCSDPTQNEQIAVMMRHMLIPMRRPQIPKKEIDGMLLRVYYITVIL